MTGFSQPERRGLARSQSAQAHPEADLLTAFSEQTLTAREREQMLAHLAVCPACREVVALAAPAVEETLPEPVPEPSAWNWSIVRWGAVAASAVIVVIAVSLGTMQKKAAPAIQQVATETTTMNAPAALGDTNQLDRKAAAAQKAIPEEVPASAGMKAPQIRYEKVAPKPKQQLAARADVNSSDLLLKKQVTPTMGAASGGVVGGIAVGGPMESVHGNAMNAVEARKDRAVQTNTIEPNSEMLAKFNAPPPPPPTGAPAKTAAAPTASETVNVVANQPMVADAAPAANTAEMVPKGRQANALHRAQVAAPMAAKELRTNALNLDQRWQVTPEGYLLSSTDEGKNWVRQLPDLRFTHVQTIGLHVWACGPDGVLMHSIDGGTNWTKVIPADGKATLQGNITSIAFTDINHGSLATSEGEQWVTSDGGKSWKKQ